MLQVIHNNYILIRYSYITNLELIFSDHPEFAKYLLKFIKDRKSIEFYDDTINMTFGFLILLVV